jgi:DNA-binding MarR family transcriptional regulator
MTKPEKSRKETIQRRGGRRTPVGLAWDPTKDENPVPVAAFSNLSAFIPYQVVLLAGYFGQELLKVYTEYGLSIGDWRVIATVAENPGMTAIDVAAQVHLDDVAVHRAVKFLENKGFLRRYSDDEDRRRKPLEVTAKGRTLYLKILPRVLSFERWVLMKFLPEEREALVIGLRNLCIRLELIPKGSAVAVTPLVDVGILPKPRAKRRAPAT